MKKSTKILLCLSAVFIGLGAILTVSALCLGVKPVSAFESGIFDFTVQEAGTSEFSQDGRYVISADGIENLYIDWVDGKIEIEAYDGSEIILEESASTLDENNSLVYRLDNKSLEINSAASRSGFRVSGIRTLSKDLHIYLPKSIAWKNVEVGGVDVDITVSDMVISNLNADFVDGELSLSNVKLEDMFFDSMAGNFTAKGSQIKKIKVDTTSGRINADLTNCPDSIKFDTLSGDVRLYLPHDSEFSLELDALSRSFNSDFEGVYSDSQFTVGNGKAQFAIDSVSSSVQILKAVGSRTKTE